MKNRITEEAISPIIGVMLMLVVTIIIAAVVSGFASNAAGNAEKPPHATIKIGITSNGGLNHDQYIVTFRHMGGDSIPSKDLRIISTYTSPNGKPYSKTLTAAQQDHGGCDAGSGERVRIPYLSDVAIGGNPSDPTAGFGNFTFMSGNILSTGNSACTGNWDSTGLLSFDVTDTSTGFGKGSVVEFDVVHIPSGVTLAHDKVVVE
jgi:flagellin-like protein